MSSVPRRFYSLDATRGVAALAVVVYHWQHFFFDGRELPASFDRDVMPLAEPLRIFYANGFRGVELFFALSGFIFYWRYGERVRDGVTSAGRFARLRFARLYPLHLATLLLVAAGQGLYRHWYGRPFIYAGNDLYHFGLNIVLAAGWGPVREPWTFNGPAWTLCVEAVLYAMFFVVAWTLGIRTIVAVAISLAGFAAHRWIIVNPLTIGVGAFFAGGCAYLLYEGILRRGTSAPATRFAVVVTVGLWALALFGIYVGGGPHNGLTEQFGTYYFCPAVLFPATILTLAMVETKRGTLAKRLRPLGDASYSIYLLHFPLQLVVAFAVVELGIAPSAFESPVALLAFLLLVVVVAMASFRWFERPMRTWLRGDQAGVVSATATST